MKMKFALFALIAVLALGCGGNSGADEKWREAIVGDDTPPKLLHGVALGEPESVWTQIPNTENWSKEDGFHLADVKCGRAGVYPILTLYTEDQRTVNGIGMDVGSDSEKDMVLLRAFLEERFGRMYGKPAKLDLNGKEWMFEQDNKSIFLNLTWDFSKAEKNIHWDFFLSKGAS